MNLALNLITYKNFFYLQNLVFFQLFNTKFNLLAINWYFFNNNLTYGNKTTFVSFINQKLIKSIWNKNKKYLITVMFKFSALPINNYSFFNTNNGSNSNDLINIYKISSNFNHICNTNKIFLILKINCFYLNLLKFYIFFYKLNWSLKNYLFLLQHVNFNKYTRYKNYSGSLNYKIFTLNMLYV